MCGFGFVGGATMDGVRQRGLFSCDKMGIARIQVHITHPCVPYLGGADVQTEVSRGGGVQGIIGAVEALVEVVEFRGGDPELCACGLCLVVVCVRDDDEVRLKWCVQYANQSL